jgi:Ca2+/H+ antiporter, TMEM165/GDT1 family
MMCCGNQNGKRSWIVKAIFIPIAIAAGVLIFGGAVMLLWNAILPGVLGISTITFWQALGILVLSKILFGGFMHGPGHHKFHNHAHDWHGKWMHMSPEEREKFKADWKERCGHTAKQD